MDMEGLADLYAVFDREEGDDEDDESDDGEGGEGPRWNGDFELEMSSRSSTNKSIFSQRIVISTLRINTLNRLAYWIVR
jgi:hypothetical protein